ncbi:hypothetical protein [Desulfonema magnum]|uniref:Uncharacterized protein n=1 Tax=Desulfonema magnum TaxID=45655 RepID=A0A975GTQ1_9BACT|nr:hypothetical protein [Desulfonema magnum]QTA93345.1 Uncharacterized protein dnm_094460 [Desulfonema magnum]
MTNPQKRQFGNAPAASYYYSKKKCPMIKAGTVKGIPGIPEEFLADAALPKASDSCFCRLRREFILRRDHTSASSVESSNGMTEMNLIIEYQTEQRGGKAVSGNYSDKPDLSGGKNVTVC